MSSRTAIALAFVLAIANASHAVVAQRAGRGGDRPAAVTRNDYSDPATWLCRPGRQDACAVDLTTTIIAPDGRLTRETFTPDPDAPIDCFYVYPTVSTDRAPTSDMEQKAPERAVVRSQFARFTSVCRPYAPMYRQVTISGLRDVLTGGATGLLTGLADIRDAWRYYLDHDNRGRGVVLIGHSQGSLVLMELMRTALDGMPDQDKLVSAILAGTVVPVPSGKNVGGAFQNIPLCRSPTQTGCVVTYASYRATSPPPRGALFGRVPLGKLEAACVNPASPGGGSSPLHAYFVTGTRQWVSGNVRIDTPFVSVPGLLTGRCASKDDARFFEITVHANPSDLRTGDIGGDSLPGWGLHQVDVSLVMGDLIDLIRKQTAAYRK